MNTCPSSLPPYCQHLPSSGRLAPHGTNSQLPCRHLGGGRAACQGGSQPTKTLHSLLGRRCTRHREAAAAGTFPPAQQRGGSLRRQAREPDVHLKVGAGTACIHKNVAWKLGSCCHMEDVCTVQPDFLWKYHLPSVPHDVILRWVRSTPLHCGYQLRQDQSLKQAM